MIKKTVLLLCFCSGMIFNTSAQVIYIHNAGEQYQFDSTLFYSDIKPDIKLKAMPVQNIKLLPSLFLQRYELNKKYLLSLENDKLLQNFYNEAGRNSHSMLNSGLNYKDFHWGWESPSNQLRGHFLGQMPGANTWYSQ